MKMLLRMRIRRLRFSRSRRMQEKSRFERRLAVDVLRLPLLALLHFRFVALQNSYDRKAVKIYVFDFYF